MVDGRIETIDIVRFKRTEDSREEVGIRINQGLGDILDVYGMPVDELYDYYEMTYFKLDMGLLLREAEKLVNNKSMKK